ncbi:MAG: triose-phosphate isomerase [Betaproteobacteria bacterium]|nr:triose-phosphate isomerase [Betaproteobacteria bacterium]
MRSKFVAGNWKMNGSLTANHQLLTALLSGAEGMPADSAAVLVPFPYLAQCSVTLDGSPLAWGAQDVSTHESGAFTGEVSAAMIADFAASYVIVGHSERRALHGESDELVAQKAVAAHNAGLIPIVCVGETLDDREAGRTEAVVARQLDAVLDGAGDEVLSSSILAYEPVWAIGTGRTASPQQAQDVHAFVRGRLRERFPALADGTRILYGGSVKAANAADLFAMADVDGGLVGGASLVPHEFMGICEAAFSASRAD